MEQKSKGCGCQTGLLRFLPIPYGNIFYVACCLHDDDYDRGGGKNERKQADRALFANCLNIIAHSYTYKPRKCVWMAIVALCFYYTVRLFGWQYFKWDKE